MLHKEEQTRNLGGPRQLAAIGWLATWLTFAGVLVWPALKPSAPPSKIASGAAVSPDAQTVAHGGQSAAVAPTKNIEEIEVGDIVLARDDGTGDIAPKRVVRVFRNTVDHLRILSIRNADGATQEIKTTNEHPFYVPDQGWVVAGKLTPGTNLLQADEQLGVVVATRLEEHADGTPVFNFEVEDFHTYYVADQPTRGPPRYLLAHNMCKDAADAASRVAKEAGDDVVASANKGTKKLLSSGDSVMANVSELRGRQLKSEFSGNQIKRLKRDMRASGFDPNHPIEIAIVNGKKIIIDGHHRARAAGAAGIKEVPVVIRDVTPEKATELLQQAAQAAEHFGLPF